jgi:hypothetical protein
MQYSINLDDKQTNSAAFSPQANYTDWPTATCRRNLVPTLVDDIKIEFEKLEHSITNIWTIKQYKTKLLPTMFFVDLKPVTNNKYMFKVEYI